MKITKTTSAERAAEILNAAAVNQPCADSDPAQALYNAQPAGTETVEHRENGAIIKLPTGQRLRRFDVGYSHDGIRPGGLGFDGYAENADELGDRKTKMKNQIEANVKAFTGQGIRNHKITVSPDGTVRVWDEIAGHYTTCHSMSNSTQGRIRKLARQGVA